MQVTETPSASARTPWTPPIQGCVISRSTRQLGRRTNRRSALATTRRSPQAETPRAPRRPPRRVGVGRAVRALGDGGPRQDLAARREHAREPARAGLPSPADDGGGEEAGGARHVTSGGAGLRWNLSRERDAREDTPSSTPPHSSRAARHGATSIIRSR